MNIGQIFAFDKSSDIQNADWKEIKTIVKDTLTIPTIPDSNIFTYYHRTKTHIWAKNLCGTRISIPFKGNESWIFKICEGKYGTLIKIDWHGSR